MESLFVDFPMSPNLADLKENLLPDPFEILQSNEFPDVVKDFTAKQSRQIVEALSSLNNQNIVNKKGLSGGFSVLHW